MSLLRKEMNTTDLQNQFQDFPIFSLEDIKKYFPHFSYRQIDRWEKKGFLQKIKKRFYCLTNHKTDQSFSFLTANRIYTPSYISLEKALKYYQLIPEEVFVVTSVSTKKTTQFETPLGNLSYRHIDPKLFWGYSLIKVENLKFLMADPEKAILDFLYFHPKLKTKDDFEEMRFNKDSFEACVQKEKFLKYLEAFQNKSLAVRANSFLKTIFDD